MGLDLAPFKANLFLYYFKNKSISNLKKSNLLTNRSFINAFHFIDGLCSVNDNSFFKKHFKGIYTEELELKKETKSSIKTIFTDIDLQ